MAKITIEKVKELNEKMSNGFTLDIAMAKFYGEKEAHKFIDLQDGYKLEASINYRNKYHCFEREITMHLDLELWKVSDISPDMLISCGGYYVMDLGKCSKKMFSDIIKKTKEFDDTKIIKLAYDNIPEVKKLQLVTVGQLLGI